jgi:hypothetical protein
MFRRLFYLFLLHFKDKEKPNLTLNSVLNRYDCQERKNRTDFRHKSLICTKLSYFEYSCLLFENLFS